jgi:hypothetical protein
LITVIIFGGAAHYAVFSRLSPLPLSWFQILTSIISIDINQWDVCCCRNNTMIMIYVSILLVPIYTFTKLISC